jgi:subtilisin family serine protease
MRHHRRTSAAKKREDLVALRLRQTELLVQRGVLRPGPGDQPVALPVWAATGGTDNDPDTHFLAIDGRVVVRASDADKARRVLGGHAGATIELGRVPFVALELADLGVREALDRLAEVAPTLRAAPQHLVFPAFRSKGQEGEDPEPVDPSEVGSPPEGTDLPGAGVKVAVVDTGVAERALGDPWLAGITAAPADIDPLREHEPGHDPRDGAPFQDLEAGHGTMVIGVVREVAPGCEVEVIRALDSDGVATDDEIARAIGEAVDRSADIINLSLGGYTDQNLPPPIIEDAIAAVPPGIAIVAAAGNFFDDRPVWPGAIRRVVSVAALDQRGNAQEAVAPKLAWYSSFGWWVDLAAPGTWATTFVEGRENPGRETVGPPDQFEGYAEAAGTSLAAAAITGALAVELSLMRQAAASASSSAPTVVAREAIGAVRARAGNQRLPQGTIAVDVWNGE